MTLDEALGAHEIVLERYGGLPGVRDLGAIESALARPYCGYYRSIEKKAAALVHSLTMNHGFLDGNKRTAVYMLGILLLGSGYALRFPSAQAANDEVENMILAVAQGHMKFDEIAAWIKAHLVRANTPL